MAIAFEDKRVSEGMTDAEKTFAAARSMDDNGTQLGRIDEALIVIDQLRKRRFKLIKEMEKRLDINENQKIFIGQEYDLWRNVKTLTDQVEGSIKAQLGRVPPNAAELEVTVLGAILLETNKRSEDGALPAFDAVKGFLLPDHFYDDRHKIIYAACLGLKGPLDMRTIVVELRRLGQLEAIGNSLYIAELTAKVSSSSNIEAYARALIEFAMKRAMIEGCSYIIQESYEDQRDPFALYEYARRQLTRIRAWIK